MLGTHLRDVRDHVESLASDDGDYRLVCARYGDQPVPATGLRFESRAVGRAAARATEQYRAALRRYDPQLPVHDVIVCEVDSRATAQAERAPTSDVAAGEDGATERSPSAQALVEFCHRVAGSVFEALSAAGHDAVETATMDAYFQHAESVADPDELCCCLLESMARELDARLSPFEQGEVCAAAADQLAAPSLSAPPGPADATGRPLDATFDSLQATGVLGTYAHSDWHVDHAARTRTASVAVSDYALSPTADELPVLPVVVELARRFEDWHATPVAVARDGDGWRIAVELDRDDEPHARAALPIEVEA
jgi:hypothetical protein